MLQSYLLSAFFGLQVAAFPAVIQEFSRRQVPSTSAARALSASRTNCGPTPCEVFDAEEQYISTTGEHAYASPAPDEIRGPCPGLNAAANHGYLPRNGVVTITQTITGLGELYGMSVDLAGFLAGYAVLLDGDPIEQTWSIGGPPETDPLTSGLLGQPQGISWSHNNYEGDSSIGRADAYTNNGDAHSLDPARFALAYAVGVDDGSDRYDLDKFAQNFATKADESVSTNPYYFAAPFATTLVSPAAYNFVANFMSNHTAEEPSGYLNGAMFKQFFAVTGDYPNFTWMPGQESIPDNWYRRTSTNQYNAANVLEDLAVQFAAYPSSFRLGGNTNGVNTYEGIDLSDITGGVYSNADLLNTATNSNAACFYTELVQVFFPDLGNVAAAMLSAVTDIVNSFITPFAGNLDCPAIDKYDQTLFNKYSGHAYQPNGPATNYKA